MKDNLGDYHVVKADSSRQVLYGIMAVASQIGFYFGVPLYLALFGGDLESWYNSLNGEWRVIVQCQLVAMCVSFLAGLTAGLMATAPDILEHYDAIGWTTRKERIITHERTI